MLLLHPADGVHHSTAVILETILRDQDNVHWLSTMNPVTSLSSSGTESCDGIFGNEIVNNERLKILA